MIDNFEQIGKLLSFTSDDEFYFCQVLKRKKENPELGSNSRVVKTYFIKSVEELEEDKGEMIMLANYHNARVYINLNKRSFERTCYHTLKKITDQIMNRDFKQAREAYASVCGMYAAETDKTWVVDVDEPEIFSLMIAHIECECEPLHPIKYGETGMVIAFKSKIIDKIRTKNGWHLITRPFDLKKFSDKYPDIDVHKNNPTILYIP